MNKEFRQEDCVELGHLSKTHGTKGYMLLRLNGHSASQIRLKELAFIECDGLLVPFFIEAWEEKGPDTLLIRFEDIQTESMARPFAGSRVFAEGRCLVKQKKGWDTQTDIKGYRVFDQRAGEIGIADEIIHFSTNELLRVLHPGGEHLIPLQREIILVIDSAKREILIHAPDGLLEL